jgi:hypothetical protein
MADLEVTEPWQKLPPAQRAMVIRAHRLTPAPELDVADDVRLLAALEQRDLQGWIELAEGLSTRFMEARADAARALEPAVQTVALKSDLLRTEAEVEAWVAATRAELLRRIGAGPIVIG